MGTANQAYGNAMFPGLPYMELGAGVRTPYGTLTPPTSRVACYVGSQTSAWFTGSNEALRHMTKGTLAEALRSVRSNLGDTIYILPGHTENVTDATMFDNLVAGTKIYGMSMDPEGADAPTFTWTATAGQWTLDQANVTIAGLKLDFTGINAVVAAIAVSAANVTVAGCHMITSDASNQCTKVFDPSAAATGLKILGNTVEGTADACGDFIDLDAATDRVKIAGNEIIGGFTNGMVNIAAAATNLRIISNVLHNTASGSTSCITVADVASSGIGAYNSMGCMSGGISANEGIDVAGTGSNMRFVQNFNSSDARASGVLSPPAAT